VAHVTLDATTAARLARWARNDEALRQIDHAHVWRSVPADVVGVPGVEVSACPCGRVYAYRPATYRG
jgi:hypothetical protein